MDSAMIFLIIVLALAVGLLVVLSGAKRPSRLDTAYYAEHWQRILALSQGTSSAQWQMAVMEGDKLLDQALRACGARGKTMGDRLKNARTKLRNNDAVWQSHKLRNRLAHETGAQIRQSDVTSALRGFEGGLKDLGALR
jgi:hypothetical protein